MARPERLERGIERPLPERLLGDVQAESTVRLELRIVEELIDGRLVRKLPVIRLVVQDRLGLVAGERALEIHEVPDERRIVRAALLDVREVILPAEAAERRYRISPTAQ